MKKIYVYVGQLRDWMLRMAKRVREVLLPDVKNTLLQSITITVLIDELSDELINDLYTMMRECPGNTEVYFNVKDSEGQCHADLKSRSLKISVQKELINYIKNREGLDYKIN